jgi:RNA recognition motif-containing protein
LENLFGRFGRINFSALTKNENGAGIVLFENRDDAYKAVQALQGRSIDNSGVEILLNLYYMLI